MRVHLGPPPNISAAQKNPAYQSTKWNKKYIEIVSAVLSVILYVGGFFIWPVKPDVDEIAKAPALYTIGFLCAIIVVIIIHEVLHLVASPGGLHSNNAAIGFNPRKFLFYSFTTARMNWRQSQFFLLAPLLILTLVPVLFQFSIGLPSGWLGFSAVCNASLSANDVVIAIYIFLRIPNSAIDVQPEITGIKYLTKISNQRG